jgi:NitT/TauT family transport system ATP-binding protein
MERGELMASPAPKIRCANVSIAFSTQEGIAGFQALANVSFEGGEGQFICIVGPSGCGKTTLLRAIAGLTPLSAGVIEVDSMPISGPGKDRSVVFQYDSLLPWRTVLKNTLLGWDIRGGPRGPATQKALDYLDLVGLSQFVNYYPHQLSGGMRQRVNLARALAVEPSVLLMDEPFAALDAQTRETMQAELLRIWRQTKRTIVFITHQVDEALFLGDRVLVMGTRPGRIIDEIHVPFERPRRLDVKGTPEFAALTQKILSKLVPTHEA